MAEKKTTVSLSGFGGSYEWACQIMLFAGMVWLEKNPSFDWSGYKTYQGVMGLCVAENKDARDLDEVLLKNPKLECAGGPTSAMHQCVVQHLHEIHQDGYENWLKQMREVRPAEDFFEFDGTVQSCPQTELSTRMERVQ